MRKHYNCSKKLEKHKKCWIEFNDLINKYENENINKNTNYNSNFNDNNNEDVVNRIVGLSKNVLIKANNFGQILKKDTESLMNTNKNMNNMKMESKISNSHLNSIQKRQFLYKLNLIIIIILLGIFNTLILYFRWFK